MENNGNYLKIPLALLEMKLSPVETYIVSLAISYGGNLYASNYRLSELFSVSDRAVSDAVVKLERRGKLFVEINRKKGIGRTITLKEKFAPFLSTEETSIPTEETSILPTKKLRGSTEETSDKTKSKETLKENSNKTQGLDDFSSDKKIDLDLQKKLLKDSAIYENMINRHFKDLVPKEKRTFDNINRLLCKAARNGNPDAFITAREILSDKLDYVRQHKKEQIDAQKMFVDAIYQVFGDKPLSPANNKFRGNIR